MKVSVNTFRSSLGDCTNNGVSSRIDDFILIAQDDLNDYIDKDTENVLVVVDGPYDTLRAVPYDLFNRDVWYMFGGNFVYTSDSRFPSDSPIKIFDRVEG